MTWESTQTRSRSGAFESLQRVGLSAPVVECSAAGAERLGDVYWREVQRSTCGLVRSRPDGDDLELRLLGVGPPLLRFGKPELDVAAGSVSVRYPILGGLLARRPAGSISFTQCGSQPVELSSAIEGFFPRLAARRQLGRWNGLLYPYVQARLHVALSRRYFMRLRREAAS